MEAAAVVMAFVALAYAGWRWGEDSVDGIDSVEWSRRRAWFGRFASRSGSRPRERARTRAPQNRARSVERVTLAPCMTE